MDNSSWEEIMQERERKIAELKERQANTPNPLSELIGEIAGFAGMISIAFILWLTVYYVGPDASRIINGWLK